MIEFERKILEECAGLRKPSDWGAAVGAALSYLRGHGYIDTQGSVTQKGWDAFGHELRPKG